MSSAKAPRYFVTTKDGRRFDTDCTLMVNDRGVITFHQPLADGAKTGPLWAFAPGAWRVIDWDTK